MAETRAIWQMEMKMQAGNSEAIDLSAEAAKRSGRVSHPLAWDLIKKAAILPAFKVCEPHLIDRGFTPLLCESKSTIERPFLILFWEGRGELAGARIGLHFTYCLKEMQFDLSILRETPAIRRQASLYRERFRTDEPNRSAMILRRACLGMGIAHQLEAHFPSSVSWTESRNLGGLVN